MIGQLKVGQNFSGMYPTHGNLNVLRNVRGEIVDTGRGPNGTYITVQEGVDKFRRLSTKKIVQM
jgi:hypothetical protein